MSKWTSEHGTSEVSRSIMQLINSSSPIVPYFSYSGRRVSDGNKESSDIGSTLLRRALQNHRSSSLQHMQIATRDLLRPAS